MALSKDRNTAMKDGEIISVPVAANAVIYAGALVVATAAGFAAPGSVATTLTYLGRAEESCNNAGGVNAAKSVLVRRRSAFYYKNHGADLVTQASIGKVCYIVDDETVALTNGANTRSAAGIVIGVDAGGVWLQ